MKNMKLLDKVKGRVSEHFNRHPVDGVLTLLGTAGVIAYTGATLAVNALFYTAQAGVEGLERACGVTPTSIVAKLEKKDVALTPSGGRISYGTFKTSAGQKLTLLDYPVVLEGKFVPGTMNNMETNKTYKVSVFGPRISQSMFKAEEIK